MKIYLKKIIATSNHHIFLYKKNFKVIKLLFQGQYLSYFFTNNKFLKKLRKSSYAYHLLKNIS